MMTAMAANPASVYHAGGGRRRRCKAACPRALRAPASALPQAGREILLNNEVAAGRATTKNQPVLVTRLIRANVPT